MKIRQGPTGVYVEGLAERPVETQEDVLKIMAEGSKNRSINRTAMNALRSPRSHAILSVSVHGRSTVTAMKYIGKLNLIDLAIRDRITISHATGIRLKEAHAINLSWSALGNVIEALQKKQSYVPYRTSKLTHVLSSSIGGNAKTLMLCDIAETNPSLQFASRVSATELGVAGKNVSTAAALPSADATGAEKPPSAATPVKQQVLAATG